LSFVTFTKKLDAEISEKKFWNKKERRSAFFFVVLTRDV